MDPFLEIARLKDYRAGRASSYDRTGGNADRIQIRPGRRAVLADLRGPGCIRHIWFTIGMERARPDRHYLRNLLLRIYWDGEKSPSVESPVGDFFGVGHGAVATYQNAAFSMTTNNPGEGGNAAMNCWLPMPFGRRARVEILNQSKSLVRSFYYYLDYQELPALGADIAYFHAKWRRENPTDGWAGSHPEQCAWTQERMKGPRGKNLTGKGNYLLLDARGRGHYVGTSLSYHNLSENWWGEGDDMFFVDGEKWPPSLHGTGSEDYFAQAWGMQKVAQLHHGVSYWQEDLCRNWRGKWTCYRLHLVDPVPFTKSLRVSIEHGHANCLSNDMCSVAYWYQTEPHFEFAPMPAAEKRAPRPDR
jgi:hypothetical protein